MAPDFDKNDPFAGLTDDLDSALIAPAKAAMRHECEICGGTGKYHGRRVHQDKAHCFACRGKGYFTTSKAQRDRAKASRDKVKEAARVKLAESIEEFSEKYPVMFEELKAAYFHGSSSNEFINSLATQLFQRGSLSPKQIDAWARGRAKLEQIIAQREAAKPTVDLKSVKDIFARALENGLKRASYRAEGLVLSPAASHGSNPGFTYLKSENGTYMGKISPAGLLSIVRDFRAEEKAIAEKLEVIVADPKAAAINYGRKTGVCCCCGRALTDPQSVAAGIGPICEARWF